MSESEEDIHSSRHLSIISYTSENFPAHCGYCKTVGSLCCGFWAHSLSAEDYMRLLNTGWRRSGRFCYKPTMAETCCPLYTIRCHAKEFEPTKSQKKVAKKVRNFLLRGKNHNDSTPEGGDSSAATVTRGHHEESNNKSDVTSATIVSKESNGKSAGIKSDIKTSTTSPHEAHARPGGALSESAEHRLVVGLKKAKIRRIEKRRGAKDKERCDKNPKKGLADLLPPTNSTTLGLSQLQPQTVSDEEAKHKLELRLVKADPGDAEFLKYFAESYLVFRKYQTTIHKEPASECDEETFRSFLCSSPMAYQERTVEDRTVLMGAFHQHYVIDGKIAAVGVIDILPDCVSSVYLFYDPAYSHLSLGTYSALREVQLTVSLGLNYYYMGYYVHTCDKMRYKGRFLPSDLLSCTQYSWHSITHCLPLLDKQKYCTFQELPAVGEVPSNSPPDLARVKVYQDGNILPYRDVVIVNESERKKFQEYLDLTGSIAERLVYVIEDGEDESWDESDCEERE